MKTGCWPHNHEPRNFAEAVNRHASEVSPASIGGIYASNVTGTVRHACRRIGQLRIGSSPDDANRGKGCSLVASQLLPIWWRLNAGERIMKDYDEEYRGYLIAYINDYTLTAIYEKTRWGPLAIHDNANIGIREKMPKAERVKLLPLRAREIIDMLIAKKAEEAAPAGQTRNQSNDERTNDREER